MFKKKLILNGKKVFYIEKGDESNPPVLLLHGVPESSLVWSKVYPSIVSNGFRVIAPDLPGFGESESFNGTSDWRKYVNFVTDFTNQLGITEFHLVVHDWGGLIGLHWACIYPHRIKSLIISNSSLLPGYKWHPIAKKWRIPELGEEVMKKYAEKESWMTNMKNEIPSVEESILVDFYRNLEPPAQGKVLLDLYRSSNEELIENHEKLSQIKNPVTILWGKNDPYIHYEYAYKIREKQLPQAEVHIIENAGHFIHLEVPEKVTPLFDQHFRTQKDLINF